MNTLIWVNPARTSKGRDSMLITAEIVELLQSYPGRWLSVGNHISQLGQGHQAHFADELK